MSKFPRKSKQQLLSYNGYKIYMTHTLIGIHIYFFFRIVFMLLKMGKLIKTGSLKWIYNYPNKKRKKEKKTEKRKNLLRFKGELDKKYRHLHEIYIYMWDGIKNTFWTKWVESFSANMWQWYIWQYGDSVVMKIFFGCSVLQISPYL